MPANPRLVELAALLRMATEQNKITWDAGENEDEFRSSIGVGSAVISRMMIKAPEGPRPRFSLTVFNQQGRVIEEFLPADPEEVSLLAELFTQVRKETLNLEHAWRTFLDQLRQRVGADAHS